MAHRHGSRGLGSHEQLRFTNAFLGVLTEFTTALSGYVLLRVKEKRRRNLIVELGKVLASGKLSPAHAARLRGKLYFTTTTAFSGVGRAALQAFTVRQYSKGGQTALNEDLRVAIQFFIELLHCLSCVPRVPDRVRSHPIPVARSLSSLESNPIACLVGLA